MVNPLCYTHSIERRFPPSRLAVVTREGPGKDSATAAAWISCTESMLIALALEIQELLWVQDSVHVQNPYKNASLIPYVIESKDWLPGMDSNHGGELDKIL